MRNFAVQHLKQKPVSELKSYLLQICECLKFERYLTNELTFTLLKKCFHDHTFAHALFWNLRIFLFDETHWLRTSLIIEALFSGIPDYRHLLEKPLQIVEKMRIINRYVPYLFFVKLFKLFVQHIQVVIVLGRCFMFFDLKLKGVVVEMRISEASEGKCNQRISIYKGCGV